MSCVDIFSSLPNYWRTASLRRAFTVAYPVLSVSLRQEGSGSTGFHKEVFIVLIRNGPIKQSPVVTERNMSTNCRQQKTSDIVTIQSSAQINGRHLIFHVF
jgi:hypothetical protein